MIYCVWYPSGGFGHFINAVLTIRGKNFVRPKKSLEFSKQGDSHQLDLVVPKYFKERWLGTVNFDSTKNYCVLVDNGIDNDSRKFIHTFPDSVVIRVCYSDQTWPIVAQTMINKAMNSNIQQELPVDNWDSNERWAEREKYFLFLKDHHYRHAWKPTDDAVLQIDDMLEYTTFFNVLNQVVAIDPFDDLWSAWRSANNKYIEPVVISKKIISAVMDNQTMSLTDITDVWTQSVIYYYIWIVFGIEVPHNDFSNFFENTDQIRELVR